MRFLPWALFFLSSVSSLMASAAAAQTPPEVASDSAYEHAVDDGLAAFRATDYTKARAFFERAHELQPSARTLRALGLTAVELKHYTQGREELSAALTETRKPLTEAQRAEIDQMMTWMQAALATVEVHVAPAQALLEVDGQPAHARLSPSLLLEAGTHDFRATAAGYRAAEQSVELTAGQSTTLELVLTHAQLLPQALAAAAPSAEQSPMFAQPTATHHQQAKSVFERWWFWTAVGVVIVGGATATAVALSSSKTAAEPAGIKVTSL
jgi:tetratricopeptide (TPR) repeat protein